jgi:hypothetical protein
MTVYVIRNGELVPKGWSPPAPGGPYISRFEAMQSPVTGKEITSWRDRDRDMAAVGAVDPRDLSRKPFEKRAEYASRQSD